MEGLKTELLFRGIEMIDIPKGIKVRKQRLRELEADRVGEEQQWSNAQIEKIVQSQSLVEFKVNIGGEAVFNQLLAEFDKLNSQKIQIYYHLLDNLKYQIQPSEAQLIDFLRPLPDLLYWRKK